jgi:hypothetical protein
MDTTEAKEGTAMNTITTLNREQIVATDTRLAEIYTERNDAIDRIVYAVRILNDVAGRRHRDDQLTLAELRTMQADGLLAERNYTYGKNTADLFTEIDERRAMIADLDAEATPLNAAFDAQRWSRFFLVTNADGHIHSSLSCSTCHLTTEFAWLPTLSDQSEAEAVAEHGGILCTVCYPSAPTEWTDQPSHAKRAAMEERAAAKAEREARKLEKALLADGSTLTLTGTEATNGRGQTYTRTVQITTLAQAKTWLREISDARAEGRIETSWIAQDRCWTPDNETTIVNAISAKTCTAARRVSEEAAAKAEKKAAKYR